MSLSTTASHGKRSVTGPAGRADRQRRITHADKRRVRTRGHMAAARKILPSVGRAALLDMELAGEISYEPGGTVCRRHEAESMSR